ncbi:MAG: alcohol dehydrogenase catalytic domain-containing protein [Anaerolineae bacterium]|nr:alcohol dehydrogenase catalytic domain-containing protein [Anaerolineae bacterium]
MQAVVVANGTVRYTRDHARPSAGSGDALVRVRLAGICATDLEIVKGYAGFNGVLGHEFVGEVVSAPHDAWTGQRVVATINMGCGDCDVCRYQGDEHCPNRTALGISRDGVFADFVSLPQRNLLPVPEEITDEAAVFTEPLAAALRIREQLLVSPRERVAVLGPGRLGLLVAQVLALAGTPVIVLGRRSASLDLPARLGLQTGLVAEMESATLSMVVETTGSPAGLEEALRLVRPLGTIVLKSTYAGKAGVDLTPLVVNEITVVGSRCGPFEPALRLLAAGQVQVEPLIDAIAPLSAAVDALKQASLPDVRKVLLRP